MCWQRMIAAILIGAICAPAVQAQDRTASDVWRAYVEKLEPDDLVRVTTTNGNSTRGYVVAVGDRGIRLNLKTRVAEPLRDILFEQIVSIDRQKEPRWNPGAKVLLGVGI